VIEKTDEGILVKVGSVPHPMEEKHYIEWIELTVDGTVLRKFLKPGDAPEAFFKVSGEVSGAREYCNVHGLWRS
jgi:superoxide reductase